MKSKVGKAQENQHHTAANGFSQRQANVEIALQFADNRAESISLQQQSQAAADNNPQAQDLTQLKSIINSSPRVMLQAKLQAKVDSSSRIVAQRPHIDRLNGGAAQSQVGLEEDKKLLQGKFETIQRQEREGEESLQGKLEAVQRQSLEEKEPLQGKLISETTPIQQKEEDIPVENKTSMFAQLKQLANTSVSQLASDYDGILPAHESYGDAYDFGDSTSSDFTYHHIIPENQLKLVAKELEGIKKYFNELQATNDNLGLRNKGGELDQKVGNLIQGANAGWVNTRIKNMTHQINSTYDNYGISISESDVRTIITSTDETLVNLFPAFRDKIKSIAQVTYQRVSGTIKRVITNALKDGGFYQAVNNSNRNPIETYLENRINTNVFFKTNMVNNVMGAINQLRQTKRSGQLNRSIVRNALTSAIKTWSFDDYYTNGSQLLYVDSTGKPNYLKKIVQKNALPHDAAEHLEHSVQWNPGNIHRGPSSSKRLNPDSGNDFDAVLDDGGDLFEKAAVNLVSTEHFKELVNLNKAIIPFLVTKVADTSPNATKVDQAKDIVDRIQIIQNKGLREFNKDEWEKKGGDKMRLRKNVELVGAATHQNLLD